MISVCLTTYNSQRFLRRQLETLLPQLSQGDELIVSDDGSTDATPDIINEFAQLYPHVHIRFIINPGPHGYTPNFENALRECKGDFIFLCDHDDLWVDNKVARCLQLLEDADFVVHDACIIDEKENRLSPSFFALRHPYRTFVGNVVKFGFLGCCMAFRRNVLSRALPFPPHYQLSTHDNWLTLVAMAYYRYVVSDEPLLAYRRHASNVSSGEVNNHRSLWFRLRYRIYLIWNLVKKFFAVHNK